MGCCCVFYSLEDCIKKNNGFIFHDNDNVVELVLKTYDLLETFCMGVSYRDEILRLIRPKNSQYYSMYEAWKAGLIEVDMEKSQYLWFNVLKGYLEGLSPKGYVFTKINGLYAWVKVDSVERSCS